MIWPIIEHEPFDLEAEIVAIRNRSVILDRAVTRVLDAAAQQEVEEVEWIDWYAEERASRTGSA